MAELATKNTKPEGVKSQAIAKYSMPVQPVAPDAQGCKVLTVGQDTGRKNKLGQAILSKSLVIATPSKPDGLSGDAAIARMTEIGKSIKPTIMGRVAAFSNQEAVIVRRYSETPGKRNKMSLTLEQVSVETELAKIARLYNMTEEEVAKRLNVKPAGTEIPV